MENEKRIARKIPGWLALFSLILTACGGGASAGVFDSTPAAGRPAPTDTYRPANCTNIYVDPAEIDSAAANFVELAPSGYPGVYCARVSDPRQPQTPEILVGVYETQSADGRVSLAMGEMPNAPGSPPLPTLEAFQELYPGNVVRLRKPLPEQSLTAVVDIRFGYSDGQQVTYAAVGTVMP